MLVLYSVSCYTWAALIGSVICQSRHQFNPTIIQDSRLEPGADGTFGFLYRTEDGISHTAKGDPTGYIQGSYSYKDPTGLKVNFNYFAGAKKSTKSAPAPEAQYRISEPQYRDPEPQYGQPETQEAYYTREPKSYQPTQEYRPRTRPPASYTRPQEYQPIYETRYTGRTSSRSNEINDVDDYQYSG